MDNYGTKKIGKKELKLVYNYKNNNLLRQSYNELCKKTFGISFELWYQKGLWKDNYICYSYRDGDKIVANVSVTKMRLINNGKEKKLLQIGTVMTDGEYRGQGLAKGLIEYITNIYKEDYEVFYLFANNNVIDFYKKFGFKKADRLKLSTGQIINSGPKYRLRKLNMDSINDIKILTKIAENRVPTSDQHYFEGSEEILYWYCLEVFKDNIYYDEDEGLILIYTTDGNILNLYDVISQKDIDYRKILASIQSNKVERTVFHFNLDTKGIKIERRKFDSIKENDQMLVRGNLNMDNLAYPVTLHT